MWFQHPVRYVSADYLIINDEYGLHKGAGRHASVGTYVCTGMYSTLRKKRSACAGYGVILHVMMIGWVPKILSSTMEHDLFAALLVIPSYCR